MTADKQKESRTLKVYVSFCCKLSLKSCCPASGFLSSSAQRFLQVQAAASVTSLPLVSDSKLLYALCTISLFILVGVSDNGPDKFPRVLCNSTPMSRRLNRLFGSNSKFLEWDVGIYPL